MKTQAVYEPAESVAFHCGPRAPERAERCVPTPSPGWRLWGSLTLLTLILYLFSFVVLNCLGFLKITFLTRCYDWTSLPVYVVLVAGSSNRLERTGCSKSEAGRKSGGARPSQWSSSQCHQFFLRARVCSSTGDGNSWAHKSTWISYRTLCPD